jgi:hypothetical protein
MVCQSQFTLPQIILPLPFRLAGEHYTNRVSSTRS